jgi:hypothetical protein
MAPDHDGERPWKPALEVDGPHLDPSNQYFLISPGDGTEDSPSAPLRRHRVSVSLEHLPISATAPGERVGGDIGADKSLDNECDHDATVVFFGTQRLEIPVECMLGRGVSGELRATVLAGEAAYHHKLTGPAGQH